MGKNTKPMLTVLVEGDKLQQFRDYALSKEVSMGWVVNRLLDRVLSGELDVMGDTVSIGTNRECIENVSTGLTREDVESMIKSSIDNRLVSSHREYIEESIKSHIDSLGISSIDTKNIEEVTKAFIELSLEPIKESVSKLEADTQARFEAVREELKAFADRAVVPATDSIGKPATEVDGTIPHFPTVSENVRMAATNHYGTRENPKRVKQVQSKADDPNLKTWGEFFKMVGIEALTAVEAQKKENTDTRTKQIEIGLQAAKEQGLGEWAVKVSGRSFVLVTPPH
jgi:hypothetical protein